MTYIKKPSNLTHVANQKGSIYWEVLQRLLEEQFTKDLLTVLGHLVLLRFTRDKTSRITWVRMFSYQKKLLSTLLSMLNSFAHTCNGFQRIK